MNLALIDIKNHIAKITINRPEALNAMSSGLISELIKAFNSLIQDDTVGVIIITGSGDKSFIAGAGGPFSYFLTCNFIELENVFNYDGSITSRSEFFNQLGGG